MLKGFNVWRKKQFVRLAAGMVACACGISLMGCGAAGGAGKNSGSSGAGGSGDRGGEYNSGGGYT